MSGITVTGDNSWLESYDDAGRLVAGPTGFQADFVPSLGGTFLEDQAAHYVYASSMHTPLHTAIQKFDKSLAFVDEHILFDHILGTNESNSMTHIGDRLYVVTIDIDPGVIWELDLAGNLLRTLTLGTVVVGKPWVSVSQDENYLFAASPFSPQNGGVSKTAVATGVSVSLPWNTFDDVDPQIASIDDKLEGIFDARELPGGDLLLMGVEGSWARVRASDGHIVRLYNNPRWNLLDLLSMALTSDGQSFWSGGFGVPSDFGLANPPGYTGGACGIIVRQSVASGATELAFATKGIPSQLWVWTDQPAPVLNLGPPAARVVTDIFTVTLPPQPGPVLTPPPSEGT